MLELLNPSIPSAARFTVGADFAQAYDGIRDNGNCGAFANCAADGAVDGGGVYLPIFDAANCAAVSVQIMPPLWQEYAADFAYIPRVAACARETSAKMPGFTTCAAPQYSGSRDAYRCGAVNVSAMAFRQRCGGNIYPIATLREGVEAAETSKMYFLQQCRKIETAPSFVPPCDWYPLPIPPAPKPKPDGKRPCGKLPPPFRLPFAFLRRQIKHDPRFVPFDFSCRENKTIPQLGSYMLQHKISAWLENEPLQVLEFSITHDVDGFCLQADITLPPDDFARLKLDTTLPEKLPVITLRINAHRFDFIAEDYRDNRAFAQRSYTVTGRSVAGRLSADYARLKGFNQAGYARQVCGQALQFTGYSIKDYQIADWYIPENTIAYAEKSPAQILMMIAQAAGGFVESHPYEQTLSLKPRWRVPAWHLKDAAAEIVIPESIIKSISGQKAYTPQCNGVFALGEGEDAFGADVYRAETDREPRAQTLSSPLWRTAAGFVNPQDAVMAAGIAALSATGMHKSETLEMPLAEEYGLDVLQLGQIVQVNESAGHWKGIVQSVSITASWGNDAPQVWQTAVVDRVV